MKRHKAPGLSGLVAEMIQSTGDIGTNISLSSSFGLSYERAPYLSILQSVIGSCQTSVEWCQIWFKGSEAGVAWWAWLVVEVPCSKGATLVQKAWLWSINGLAQAAWPENFIWVVWIMCVSGGWSVTSCPGIGTYSSKPFCARQVSCLQQLYDKPIKRIYLLIYVRTFFLQCFDAVGWAAGRASGL